jgi:peptidoglycan/LPS O-acetylase OafA/YrhL
LFVIPFFLLLMRPIKRRVKTLSMLCGALIVISFLDVYWIVAPAFEKAGPRFYLLDFLLPFGMGGIWVSAFLAQLKSRPLLPLHDPRFQESFEHGD